ncbi:MAG: Sec-independent protein translocase protein TatB [Alphaproteobacteria bacterium]
MFDISWMEMLMIAVVAIVVIGPKDLPKVLHTVGQWMARARSVARNFQEQMDEMARQSGVDDVRKQIQNSMSGLDPAERLRKEIDPTGEMDAQMKAMADLGRIEPDAPPAKTAADVAVSDAQADAALPAPAEAPVEPLPDAPPEPPLEPGQTAYKGPTP